MPSLAETLLIEGPDALAFAHAQFSSDVQSLAVGAWQFSAWLNAQGRVRALFHLVHLDEHRLLLLLRGGDAHALGEALRRYVFRSRLTISIAPWRILSTATALPLHEAHVTPDSVVIGGGTHALRISAEGEGEGDTTWRHAQLLLGWPWLPASTLETLLPPALSLHRLHAVAIDKGCYPGQEIVARLHWRGGHKRHLCSVELTRDAAPGDVLRRDGNDVGVLLDAVPGEKRIDALAVLDDDTVSAHVDHTVLRLDGGLVLHLQHQWKS